jgi:hypothetical protein
MIIAFQSTQIRDLCEDPDAADRHMGRNVAEVFRDRLADVRAAASVEDLIVGNPRRDGPESEFLRIAIGRDIDIVLKANHRRSVIDGSGRVDWTHVSYVKMIEVEGL